MTKSENDIAKKHRWRSTVVIILLVLASAASVIDIWDGYWLKAASSVLIVLAIVALLFARRYHSSRWRVAMLMAFTLAALALFARLAFWQGWV